MNAQVWHKAPERGTSIGLSIVLFFLNTLGYWAAKVLIYPIVFYFYVTDKKRRSASLTYLDNLHAFSSAAHAPPTFIHGYKHYLSFAFSVLDRLYLWQGKLDKYRFIEEGKEAFLQYTAQKRGCLLIGAHLGSYDAMRVLLRHSKQKINVVMYTDNATKINKLIKKVNPDSHVNIIKLTENSVTGVIALKNCIDNGELVALLADRIPPSSKARTISVPFLGKPAAFPQGPWILAYLLECPVFIFAGVLTAKKTYYLLAKHLTDKVDVSRKNREADLTPYVAKYANFLEQRCLQTPYQWFNFFDFWSSYD